MTTFFHMAQRSISLQVTKIVNLHPTKRSVSHQLNSMKSNLWFGVFICAFIRSGFSEEAGKDDKTDYCQKSWECGPSMKHFMCEFKKNKKTEKCSQIEAQISDKERKEVLKLVNDFRQNLAGGGNFEFPDGASDMRQMTWDYQLENFAEVYGTQCGSRKVPDLDPCAKTEEFPQGTRLLWGTVDNGIDDVITGPAGWTSVVPDPDVISSFEPIDGNDRLVPNYGRFTMLAWASTYKMGCSIIRCSCGSRAERGKLVCFFGPSGDIGGKPVFQR